MLRFIKWIIAATIFSMPMVSVFGQAAVQTFKDDYSYRELNPGVDGSPSPIATGDMRYLYHWHPSVGFDESQVKEGCYRGSSTSLSTGGVVTEFMNWRVIYPNGYDASGNTKYPMIIMLHGAGEGGRLWSGSFDFKPTDVDYDNNGKNIYWGGQPHLDAVNTPPPNPRAFPGIVIWPQCSNNGAWDSGWDNGNQNQNSIMVTRILEHFIKTKGADPDRIYMHGLSNGAVGTWDLAAKRPDLFAAILPMSGTPRDLNAQTDILITTPIWLSQGGLDTNPVPQAAITCVATLQAKGQDPRYSYYPNVGHDTWNYTYSDPEFFSWMLSKTKRDIYVFGGDPNICSGGSLKMGFSAGMTSYQWYLNGTSLGATNGAQTRFYTTSVTGTYTVKYVRPVDGLQITSNALVVGSKGTSTLSPTITSSGSLYETVEQPGVTNPISFTAPLGYASYSWFKNGTAISAATNLTSNKYNLTLGGTGAAGDAGSYTVKVLEGTGCQSLPSNGITVVYYASQPTSNRPTAPSMTAITPTSVNVTWPDYGSEVSYELWRYRFSNTTPAYGFQSWGLMASLPANTTSFIDNTIRPTGTYRYAIRAILSDGHGLFSVESGNYKAPDDNVAPTPPTSLFATNVKDTQVTLTWSPSYDNDDVYKYEVYNGATLVTTLTGGSEALTAPATTTNVTGLVPGTTYVLSVRAIDYKGNPSAFADPVSVTTLSALPGLVFKYYKLPATMPGASGAYMPEPAVNGSFDFTQTPTQTGSVATFDISGANTFQNTGDPNEFVYAFDGFINIPFAGNYRFQTGSDDGSRLYINGTLLVNNDYLQGTTYRDNGSTGAGDLTLPAGKIPIRVTYFEEGGGNVLDVQWEKTDSPNGFGWVTIPANVLYQSGVTIKSFYLVTGATDPSLLASWTTNSNGTAGTAPTDFTTALQNFTLANASTVTISNPWAVSGNGSKVIVGDGTNAITVNVNAAYAGPMDAKANATINVSNATVPVFGTLDANSTVNFNVAGTGTLNIPNATYGNVNFTTPNTYVLPLNATTIMGDLVVADGAKTQGTTVNVSALRIGGDLTFNNTAQNPLPNGNQAYALSFVGGTNHVVSFNTGIDPTFFSIQTDVNDDVSFVNSGTPTYTVGSALGGGIILKSGSTLNLGAGNLVLSGAGTINPNFETGSLIMSGGNVTISSTAAQNSTVNFDPTGNTLTNLSVTAPSTTTVNLGSVTNVKNTVTLGGGLLNGGTSGFLTLWSDSLTNARIATIPAGARISGSITAQRFMAKKNSKVYRYISSPVKYATAAMLQDAFPITGDFIGANTIAGVPHSSASMFTYNEPNYVQFPAVGGTNADTMKVGLGYTAYMRKTSGGVKWIVQGPPNQGTIDYSALLKSGTNASTGWNLVGNPYASSIVWTGSSTGGWTIANINATVYVRDNTDASTYTWRVYRTGITAGEYAVAGKALLTGGVIAAGQAFWVQAGTGVPVLKITEAAKSATNVQVYKTGNSEPTYDVLTVALSNGANSDVTFIAHDANATDAYEPLNDASKQLNSGFNLSSLSSDKIDLVINMTPQVYCEKSIPLNITNATPGNFSLTFDGIDAFETPTTAILKDSYLNKTFAITSGAKYDFAITSDAASTGADRFAIIENPIVNTGLSLTSANVCETNPIIAIASAQSGVLYQAFVDGVAVSDSVRAAGDTLRLSINKKVLGFGSHNVNVAGAINGCQAVVMDQGVTITIDTLQIPVVTYKSGQLVATPGAADHYQWYQDGKALKGKTDAKLLATEGSNYQVEVSTGTCTKISQIFVMTGFEANTSGLTAYPNPFTDKITVTLPEPTDSETAVLYSILGQSVQTSSFSNSGTQQVELKFPNLEPGAYILGIGSHRIKVVKVN